MHLIDTNVAIHLRDRDRNTILRLRDLTSRPALSIITLVELEGGVAAKPRLSAVRRERLDTLLVDMFIVSFDEAVVAGYRDIVSIMGFSRSRILDRLIAATAIVHDLTLVTINAADFRDIPGLKLEIWPAQ